jgi:hypothetical protein
MLRKNGFWDLDMENVDLSVKKAFILRGPFLKIV